MNVLLSMKPKYVEKVLSGEKMCIDGGEK